MQFWYHFAVFLKIFDFCIILACLFKSFSVRGFYPVFVNCAILVSYCSISFKSSIIYHFRWFCQSLELQGCSTWFHLVFNFWVILQHLYKSPILYQFSVGFIKTLNFSVVWRVIVKCAILMSFCSISINLNLYHFCLFFENLEFQSCSTLLIKWSIFGSLSSIIMNLAIFINFSLFLKSLNFRVVLPDFSKCAVLVSFCSIFQNFRLYTNSACFFEPLNFRVV